MAELQASGLQARTVIKEVHEDQDVDISEEYDDEYHVVERVEVVKEEKQFDMNRSINSAKLSERGESVLKSSESEKLVKVKATLAAKDSEKKLSAKDAESKGDNSSDV